MDVPPTDTYSDVDEEFREEGVVSTWQAQDEVVKKLPKALVEAFVEVDGEFQKLSPVRLLGGLVYGLDIGAAPVWWCPLWAVGC